MMNSDRIPFARHLISALLMALLLSACPSSDHSGQAGDNEKASNSDNANKQQHSATTPESNADTAATSATSSGDINRGHKLVSNCAACHGEYGERNRNGAPFLAGLKSEYLASALRAYQDGNRKNEKMRGYVKDLSAQDIADLSLYFSSQGKYEWKPEPKHAQTKYRSISRGRVASTPCVDCHGLDGNSHIAEVPSLAGISPDYFIYAFDNYFSERRKGTVMKHFKHAVNWEVLHDLADYYSSLPRMKSTIKVPGKAARGEKLAKTCAKCHGLTGETIVSSMPDLARQNPQYLVGAIRAYQSGKRQNALMKSEVMGLKDQAIKDIASYYAQISLTLENPEQSDTQASSIRFDPIGEGEKLSSNCVGCHGKQGNSSMAGIPSLAGMSPQYFITALNEYKTGQRRHQMMRSFAEAIDRSKADKLAFYFYAQTRKPRFAKTPPVKPDIPLLANCNGCHGDFGQGDKPTIPALAGQDAKYLENALLAYHNGRREQADMQDNTKDLSEATIKQLAEFYSLQIPLATKAKKFVKPQDLSVKCHRCHGEDGRGIGSTPRIAGQTQSYLISALLEYKHKDRQQSTMFAMADVLTYSEIEGIANYYAHLGPTQSEPKSSAPPSTSTVTPQSGAAK